MHLADAQGVVTRPGEFAGQRVGVIAAHVGLSSAHAENTGVPLVHAGHECGACGNTAWHSGIRVSKARALARQLVDVRRLHRGMTVAAQAIASLLVGHDQEDVRSVVTHDRLTGKRKVPNRTDNNP